MINLLPDDYKKEIRAARSNVLLLRYNFLFLGCAAFVLLSSLVVFVFLRNIEGTAKAKEKDNSNQSTKYAATKKNANEYRKNLDTAKKILDNEVIYTSKIIAITKLLPSGVVLDALNLNAQEFGKPTVLSAHAKSYDRVTALKTAFEGDAAKKIISDVHFQSITAQAAASPTIGAPPVSAPPDSDYPIGVTISVTFNKAGTK